MFDLRAIRDNPNTFKTAWNRKAAGLGDETVPAILSLDEKLRTAVAEKQEAETARNTKSKLIGKAKASGNEEEAQSLMAAVAGAKAVIEEAGRIEAEIQAELNAILMGTPNLPLGEVPEGEDEAGNLQQGNGWGAPKTYDFEVKDHADLGADLKNSLGQSLMDFESAAAMSGARFVALRGGLAKLERALSAFMLDTQTAQNGYEEISPPTLVREEAMLGTGQLPKFGEESFQTTDGLWLIATSEISLTNLVREQILSEEQLPMRMTAHTPCFRSEAGSAGRDTKGMIRLHQFNKVELVSIVRDEAEGLEELERMTRCAEGILEALELPYRRMLLCTGDMGFGARKTYDLEVWLPSQNTYREISSCSYCGDFQARRMKARWRPDASEENQKPKPEFVHTLNGSGLAVGRTLVAVLENYQNADGSITVPEVLRSYMGGLEVIA
ncbi:MAG: serine--tRNA ligase [Pseudomonadota bacterium]